MKRHLSNGTFEDVPDGDEPKLVTIEQIIEAIRLGGYTQAYQHILQDDEEGNIIDACAIGQAALNLGVSFPSLSVALEEHGLLTHLILWNDVDKKKLPQIARSMKSTFKDKLKVLVACKTWDYSQEFINYQGIKI